MSPASDSESREGPRPEFHRSRKRRERSVSAEDRTGPNSTDSRKNRELPSSGLSEPNKLAGGNESDRKNSETGNIYGRTGGAYIPPARLRQMQAQITDKSSEAYQRIAWEALKKSIHGFINKVNVSNISDVVRQLLCENIVRGRGLLARSLLTAQFASPTFTHVFAALVAVVNSKFPQVGELVLKRLINEFRKAFRRNQKDRCLSTARFLAHLVNQKVVHELIVLELLTLLLEQTTDDSVEVAVSVLKECGAMLTRLVPKGVHGVFEHLRRILNEGNCDKRISYMLEVMFQIRRDGWKDHPIVLPELDLIPEDDQITHTTSLLDQVDPEDSLNVFRFDPDYLENEEKYAKIKASFFESDDESEDGSGGEEDDDEGEESGSSNEEGDEERPQGAASASAAGENQQTIIDRTETNLVQLRRTIYLMLQSSLSADEAGHRLLQLKIKPGEEYEVASMVLDCCAQTRSYESRYGKLAQRLCSVILTSGNPPPGGAANRSTEDSELGPGRRYKSASAVTSSRRKDETPAVTATEEAGPPRSYVAEFEKIFAEQYAIIHRLETAKLRNVALFFAHLLYTDSISWGVLECVHLNERDTTSSGRIFLKHLFLELCSFMGLAKLQNRLRDETLQPFFAGLLPRDNPKDTRFAINFLTTIGLGGLTLDLREHLQASREAALAKRDAAEDSILSSTSSSEESPSSSSASTSNSSDSDRKKKRKKRKKEHRKHKHGTSQKSTEKHTDGAIEAKDGRKKGDQSRVNKNVRRGASQLKERPLDTPFFNDTPNSPSCTKHMTYVRPSDHHRVAKSRADSSPNSDDRFSDGSPSSSVIKSTVTVMPRNLSPPQSYRGGDLSEGHKPVSSPYRRSEGSPRSPRGSGQGVRREDGFLAPSRASENPKIRSTHRKSDEGSPHHHRRPEKRHESRSHKDRSRSQEPGKRGSRSSRRDRSPNDDDLEREDLRKEHGHARNRGSPEVYDRIHHREDPRRGGSKHRSRSRSPFRSPDADRSPKPVRSPSSPPISLKRHRDCSVSAV
ncbi:unnamed protein product [Calicophoron daubneyi]|uniref:MI domain-containing protein n=1 Tax=Calicophoron daubneyi TaxID=300641 RepID=A0AAV2TSS7_CALDB